MCCCSNCKFVKLEFFSGNVFCEKKSIEYEDFYFVELSDCCNDFESIENEVSK